MPQQVQAGWEPIHIHRGWEFGSTGEVARYNEAFVHPGRTVALLPKVSTGNAATSDREIRQEKLAPVLRAQGQSFKEIALTLGISAIHARDLCRRHDRRLHAAEAASPPPQPALPRPGCRPRQGLSGRALRVLLHGAHASIGGATIAERLSHLPQIAASWRRDDLLAEPGIGETTLIEIELWLASLGLHFLRTGRDGRRR